MQLRGPDATMLSRLAAEALDSARTVPGAADVALSARGPREELTVEIDRSLAGAMGLSVAQVGQAMRAAFAGIDEIEVGMAFDTEGDDGRSQTVWITAVDKEVVTIDLNHPLAGETLHFDVEIVAVRKATNEELSHGHVHGPGGHHH